jgi:hypothetical protein
VQLEEGAQIVVELGARFRSSEAKFVIPGCVPLKPANLLAEV